jgi:hypothetical protein
VTREKSQAFYEEFIALSPLQAQELEMLRKMQRQQKTWHDARKLHITASTAKQVPVSHTTDPSKFLSGRKSSPSSKGTVQLSMGEKRTHLLFSTCNRRGNMPLKAKG